MTSYDSYQNAVYGLRSTEVKYAEEHGQRQGP